MGRGVYAACILALLLTGCSKPPTLADVEPKVRKYWAPCGLVKLTDIREIATAKVGGAKYRMEYAYTLEVLYNPVDLIGGGVACPRDHITLLEALSHEDFANLKKGMQITATLEETF